MALDLQKIVQGDNNNDKLDCNLLTAIKKVKNGITRDQLNTILDNYLTFFNDDENGRFENKKKIIDNYYKTSELNCEVSNFRNIYHIHREMDKIEKKGKITDAKDKKDLLAIMHIANGSGKKTIENYKSHPIVKRDFWFLGDNNYDVNERTRFRLLSIAFLLGFNSKEASELLSMLHINGKIHYRDYIEVIFSVFMDNPDTIYKMDILEADNNDNIYERYKELLWTIYLLEPKQLKSIDNGARDALIRNRQNNIHPNLSIAHTEGQESYQMNIVFGNNKKFNSFEEFKTIYNDYQTFYGNYNQTLRYECTREFIDMDEYLENNIISELFPGLGNYKEVMEEYFRPHGINPRPNEVDRYCSVLNPRINTCFTRFDLIYLSLVNHEIGKRKDRLEVLPFGVFDQLIPQYGNAKTPPEIARLLLDVVEEAKQYNETKSYSSMYKAIKNGLDGCEQLSGFDEKCHYLALFYMYKVRAYIEDEKLPDRMASIFEAFEKAVSYLCMIQSDKYRFNSLKSVIYQMIDCKKQYADEIAVNQNLDILNKYRKALENSFYCMAKNKHYHTYIFNIVSKELLDFYPTGSDEHNKISDIIDKTKKEYLPELIKEINSKLEKSGFSRISEEGPKGLFDLPFIYLIDQDLPWTENIPEFFYNTVEQIQSYLKDV